MKASELISPAVGTTRLLPDIDVSRPDAVEALADEVRRRLRAAHPDLDQSRVEAAIDLAGTAHAGVTRTSGEPYFTHPLAVACVVAALGLDDISVAAAICHDVVEDCDVTVEELAVLCGPEVAAVVDGVTKIHRAKHASAEETKAATVRKMLLAIAGDVRVLLVKLADRLHNCATLDGLPAEKQQRIAKETLELYAPLAARLGAHGLKRELEDLSFAHSEPAAYAEVAALVASRAPHRDAALAALVEELTAALADAGIEASVTGRTKHLFSVYRKMADGRTIDDIDDLVGIRVCTTDVGSCYAALGITHQMWTPVPGRVKDYIAVPKFNFYQSLHATVQAPGGIRLECQFRTVEMHRRAEIGLAAHFAYKEGGTAPAATDLAWFRRLYDWQDETAEPGLFLEHVTSDLASDEVFVFTPAGELITLPAGATVVDLAYAIHTNVGHTCIGARAAGVNVAPRTQLISGQTVEVATKEGTAPNPEWLGFVVTARARARIRTYLSKTRRSEATKWGREGIVRAARAAGVDPVKAVSDRTLESVAAQLGFGAVDELLVAVADGQTQARLVVDAADLGFGRVQDRRRGRRRPQPSKQVRVNAEGPVRLARCCTPIPGDRIVAATGVETTVHRAECPAVSDGRRKLIEASWQPRASAAVVTIEVVAIERSWLLRDVTEVIGGRGGNIVAANTVSGDGGRVWQRFELDLPDAAQLGVLLEAIASVESVIEARRSVPRATAAT